MPGSSMPQEPGAAAPSAAAEAATPSKHNRPRRSRFPTFPCCGRVAIFRPPLHSPNPRWLADDFSVEVTIVVSPKRIATRLGGESADRRCRDEGLARLRDVSLIRERCTPGLPPQM